MKIRVLVSGAGGDVGQGVMKALFSSCLNIEIYTTCISKESSWLHHKDVIGFIAPYSDDEDYIDWIIKLIQKYQIDVFFPTVDSEILKISLQKHRIETETKCKVFVDDVDKVKICSDKYKTAKFLKENNFPYPLTAIACKSELFLFLEKCGFPLILKKREGKGAQDVFKIEDEIQLHNYLENDAYIIQEWLDPSFGEYTTGIYLGDDGNVKGICTFKRKLKGGSTFIAERVIDPILEKQLEDIAKVIGMKYINIQSMRKGNELVPFEFNGRLSGSTSMISRVFNAPEMFINEKILNKNLTRIQNSEKFIAMRYYEEIYTSQENIYDIEKRSKLI